MSRKPRRIDRFWRLGDRLELLISFILKGAQLDQALEDSLLRAEAQALPNAAARRAAQQALLAAQPPLADLEDRKRALLQSVTTDLQERGRRASQIRSMRWEAVRFVQKLAVLIMIIVALPLIFYVWHLISAVNEVSWISGFIASFPNFGLFTAVSFGALGALFSRFIVLQTAQLDMSLDKAGTYYSIGYIVLRILFGTVAAIIVYFFVGSGLVEGSLVPDIRLLSYVPAHLTNDTSLPPIQTYLGTQSTSAMVPTVNMCLLIVWAFLAGFSEQLLPSLLDETSRRFQSLQTSVTETPHS